MPEPGHPIFVIGSLVVGAALVWFNVWRAWLVISPGSLRVTVEDPGEVVGIPGVLEPVHDIIRTLGFVSIGSHTEQPRLGAPTTVYDYANVEQGVFASLHIPPKWGIRKGLWWAPRSESDGPAARLTFVTPAGNGFVVSSNFRRPGANVSGRYLCGAIEGVSPERLLRAHLRRVPELGAPSAEWNEDGRVKAVRDCVGDAGKKETRQMHGMGLLWVFGGLGLIGAAVVSFIR